jgi:hypothetical protein
MLTAGLCAPGPADLEQRTYVRKGRTVYRFTLSEDNYIERRRAEGLSMRQIAKLASAVYKTHRTPHAIAIRLTMLAAREDAA